MFADVRFAIRQLAKTPGFTAVVVLSLALGIGANTTVLCWLKHLVLRPLPGVTRQTDLVVLASNQGSGCISALDSADFGRLSTIFSGILTSQNSAASLEVGDERLWINAQVVSAGFFDVLGVKPILGRTFLPAEDQHPGGDHVVVIGEKLWRRQFAADPQILGREVDINRHRFTIVGVVPAEFVGTMTPTAYELWAPRSMMWEIRNQRDGSTRSARGWHNLARLQPGVSRAEAQGAVDALNAQLAASFPETNRDTRHRVLPLQECPWGAQTVMGPGLRLLLLVSLGVLLIVAVNVANLLLARAAARQKEVAVRLAAGANRRRLVRQFLTESMLVALLGGACGVVLASWMVDSFSHFLPPGLAGRINLNFPLDGATLLLTLLLTLGTGIVFGLFPALQASQANVYEVLKYSGRSISGDARHHRLRNGLVIAEIAIALILLIAASLCLKGFDKARQVPFGFDPANVLVGTMQVGMNGYTPDTGRTFYRELRARLAAVPGVEEAAFASWFPLGLAGCKGSGVDVEGYERRVGEDSTYEYAIVSPRYFAALRIPLLGGRDFTDLDNAESAPVAIVNEVFAQRFWPNREALGQKFRAFGKWRTVVGVTKAGKYNRLSEPPHCFYYLPYQESVPDLDLGVCVRTAGAPSAFTDDLRRIIRTLDPGVELLTTIPLSDYTQAVYVPQRVTSGMLSLLGLTGLMLAAMGVYAVMAYTVSQRIQEFGVRLALGARPFDVIWQVMRRGLQLAIVGTAVGLLVALVVTRLLSTFLYGVSPFDPLTFIGVPVALNFVAMVACYVPANRATRVNPIVALRSD